MAIDDGDPVGRGIRFPLVTDPQGGLGTNHGTARIEQSIRLVLLTYPGERPTRPEFGSLLRDHVFGLVTPDEMADLGRDVRTALDRWEPRIEVADVRARPAGGEGVVHVDIAYRIRASGEPHSLTFGFDRLPASEED